MREIVKAIITANSHNMIPQAVGSSASPATSAGVLGETPLLATGEADATSVVFIDLDGTLVKADLLHESLLLLLKRPGRPLARALRGLLNGRAAFKRAVASAAMPDVSRLPFREEVLEYAAQRKSEGCSVVLATASDGRWARAVAGELQLFDDVLASDGAVNLKGRQKLSAMSAYCAQRGIASWQYVGDNLADLPIWQVTGEAVLVAPSARLQSRLRACGVREEVLMGRGPAAVNWLRAVRPQHWLKNLLVFVPLVTSHQLLNLPLLMLAVLAFVAFSLAASAGYVVNDLLDIEADRRHPKKRQRPFAAGDLSVAEGAALAAGLLAGAVALCALALPPAFAAALIVYLATTVVYSAWLKRAVLLDVITLAGLYTLRIVAGGYATGVVASDWLMAFALFFFLSLAFAKRFSELRRLAAEQQNGTLGRGYLVNDLGFVQIAGVVNGHLAVLVFALYIKSDEVRQLYTNEVALWLICPALLYWIARLWLQAQRGELSEDPVVQAVTDKVSLSTAGVIACLLAAASRW